MDKNELACQDQEYTEWDLEIWSKVTKIQNMRGGSTDSEGLQYIVGRLVLSIKFVFLWSSQIEDYNFSHSAVYC